MPKQKYVVVVAVVNNNDDSNNKDTTDTKNIFWVTMYLAVLT
jgi:hypothetical protein